MKPLKLEDGKVKQFSDSDVLPNDSEITRNNTLMQKLLFELSLQGFRFNDTDLINELNKYT